MSPPAGRPKENRMHRPLIVAALLLLPTVLNPADAKAAETIRVGLIQMDGRL